MEWCISKSQEQMFLLGQMKRLVCTLYSTALGDVHLCPRCGQRVWLWLLCVGHYTYTALTDLSAFAQEKEGSSVSLLSA